ETIWNTLKRTSQFDERRASAAAFNARSVQLNSGLVMSTLKFGISFTATFYSQAGALVIVYRDGTVQVNHGGTEMGQGLFTKILQIAAGTLGVPVAQIRVMPTRTDKVPNTSATAASSGSDLNGAAVVDACEQIKDRLATVAAAIFDSDASAVRFANGQVAGGASSISFGALGEVAARARVLRVVRGDYRTPRVHLVVHCAR